MRRRGSCRAPGSPDTSKHTWLEGHGPREARLPPLSIRPEALLFGESASRAVLSCAQEQLQELLGLAREQGVPALTLGRTGGERIRIEPGVDVTLAEAHDVWSRTLPEALA